MIVFDMWKSHPQLFEAGLHLKMIVSATNLLVDGGWRVLRMTNAFGYFGQNQSNK